MQTLYFDTVIVGSGFAGRTVADWLPKSSFMIVERGEDRDFGEVLRRYDEVKTDKSDNMLAQEVAYRSDLPWNRFRPLSRWNYSRYAMIRGGASNWWGGKSTRFSRAVFAPGGRLEWPLSHEEMQPWYERAERRLNVTGDASAPGNAHVAPMAGAAYWRDAFAPYFDGGHLYTTALNKNPAAGNAQGMCVGRSNCAICREDAKARPDNIFAECPALYGTLVLEILFEGDSAVALECYDGKQVFRIELRRLVLAANGIETPRLLGRSALPAGVRRAQIGAFLQDHAHLELSCKIDTPLQYGNAGGLTHVEIQELSGMYQTSQGELEVSALAVTHAPQPRTFMAGMDLDLLRRRGVEPFMQDLNGCFDIFCELEIPPQAGLRVDLESEDAQVLDDCYPDLVPVYDEIAQEMALRLARRGVSVVGINPVYRTGYGGHHFCGTTSCARGPEGVVDADMKLIGTSNVYIAGASVIPRAGGVAPTLTLVALAERLGHLLSGAAKPAA
jgi:choline dehydrogenase-like flavoprotein